MYLIITIAYEPISGTSKQSLDVQATSSQIFRINVSNGNQHYPLNPFLLIEASAPSEVATARLRPLRKSSTPFSLLGRHRPPLFEKSNVLVLYVVRFSFFSHLSIDCCGLRGPTGSGIHFLRILRPVSYYYHSGKTLLARTLAKVLDVPFSVSDATSFTQVRGSQSIRKQSFSFCYRQGVSRLLFSDCLT